MKMEGDVSMSALPGAVEAVRCVGGTRCGWRVFAQRPVGGLAASAVTLFRINAYMRVCDPEDRVVVVAC